MTIFLLRGIFKEKFKLHNNLYTFLLFFNEFLNFVKYKQDTEQF